MPTSRIERRMVWIALHHPEDQKILLIDTERHRGFSWEMPSGKVQPHETVRQAATRELKAATGLIADLKLVRYRKQAVPKPPNTFNEYYMFTGMYDGRSVIRLESPTAEYHWSTINEALHLSAERWAKHYLYSIHP